MSIIRNLLPIVTLVLLTSCSFLFIKPPPSPSPSPAPPKKGLDCGNSGLPTLDLLIGVAYLGLTLAGTASYATALNQEGSGSFYADLGPLVLGTFTLGMASAAALHFGSAWYGYATNQKCRELRDPIEINKPSLPLPMSTSTEPGKSMGAAPTMGTVDCSADPGVCIPLGQVCWWGAGLFEAACRLQPCASAHDCDGAVGPAVCVNHICRKACTGIAECGGNICRDGHCLTQPVPPASVEPQAAPINPSPPP